MPNHEMQVEFCQKYTKMAVGQGQIITDIPVVVAAREGKAGVPLRTLRPFRFFFHKMRLRGNMFAGIWYN